MWRWLCGNEQGQDLHLKQSESGVYSEGAVRGGCGMPRLDGLVTVVKGQLLCQRAKGRKKRVRGSG